MSRDNPSPSNSKPIIAIAATIITIAASTWIAIQAGIGSPTAGSSAYFYDLTTGRLITAPASSESPIDTPDGQAVKALVAGCGSCSAENLRIVRIEKLTDDARKALATMRNAASKGPVHPAQFGDIINKGTMVAEPAGKAGQDPQWVVQSSPRGMAVLSITPQQSCQSEEAVFCSP